MYDSDLSDNEWELIYNLFDVGNYVTPAKHSKGVLVNAVFYLADSGCKWRQLPKCFPKWKAVALFLNPLICCRPQSKDEPEKCHLS